VELGQWELLSPRRAATYPPLAVSPGGHRRDACATCACERTLSERCKSAPYVHVQYEVDCNCVAARRGGEQQETNDQSVASANPIWPDVATSRRGTCEVQSRVECASGTPVSPGQLGLAWAAHGRPVTLNEHGYQKAMTGGHQVVRDGMVGRQSDVKQGELSWTNDGASPSGAVVRTAIVAEKPVKAGGAKGGRKMNSERKRA